MSTFAQGGYRNVFHRLCLCLSVLTAAVPQPGDAQILLAGGSLPVCSSMTTRNCKTRTEWPEQALDTYLSRATETRVERWQASLGEFADPTAASKWRAALDQMASENLEAVTRGEWAEQFSPALAEWYDTLDSRSRSQLFDHFQEPVGAHRETVRLKDSRSEAAIEIFERFVAMARETTGRERPRIGFSTASSRDPYDALEFYWQVFDQAGAEAHWLPLDRAFTAARAADRCENLADFQAELLGTWDRERVFPDAFRLQQRLCNDPDATLELAENLDGLFLNGGDQWLTLHAFIDEDGRPTPEWRRIMVRLEAGEMVLGGTSAGAAVQSGPVMISNGSSRRALLEGAHEQPPPGPGCDRAGTCPPGLSADSLTFHRGGLGSFSPGIVDTHFSERWRQFRLLQLMLDSDVALGLGVDETSAIEVTGLFDDQPLALQAHGDSGGWLIMTDSGIVESRHPLQIRQVGLHHLAPGAVLQLDGGTAPDSGNGNQTKHLDPKDAENCYDISQYDSFETLPLTRAGKQDDAPPCFSWALDAGHSARSQLRVIQPPASARGPVSSWDWSLQVSVIAAAAPD